MAIVLPPIVVSMYSDGAGGYRSAVPSVNIPLPTNLITSSIGVLLPTTGVSRTLTGQQTTSVTSNLTTQTTKQVSLTGQNITSSRGSLSQTVVSSKQLIPAVTTSAAGNIICSATRFPIVAVSGISTTASIGIVSAGAPTIDSVTISGTSFGTRSALKAFFWQPFTSSTDAVSSGYASLQMPYGSGSATSSVSINNTGGRSTSKGALKLSCNFTGAADFFPHYAVDTSNQGLGDLNSQQIYYSFWFKHVRTVGTDNSVWQFKGQRWGWAPNKTVNYYFAPPRMSPSHYPLMGGGYAYMFQEVVRTDGADDASEGFNFDTPVWNNGGWNFLEGWGKFNDIGTANGFYLQRINGVDMSPGFFDAGNSRSCAFRDASEASKLITFMFLTPGLDFANSTGTNSTESSFTEHFIDTTPQRVVLTDNTTYASSTKWSFQPEFVSWIDTEVVLDKAKMNFAGFTPGSTAYAHVIGPANTVRATSTAITVPS